MSAEIVNLNKVRKAKDRAQKERDAEANRLKFGMSKPERTSVDAEAERRQSLLDGAKRDTASGQASEGASEDDIDPGSAS